MGTATLRASAQVLVDMAKPGKPRAVNVIRDPLPADARVLDLLPSETTKEVFIQLESAEWDGDVGELPPPFFQVLESER